MPFAKFPAAAGIVALIFIGPASGADSGSDLGGLINGYISAEQRLRPSTDARVGQKLDRYDENVTAQYMADRRKLNEGTSTRLNAIDRSSLKPQDQITYDIFRWELNDEAGELAPGVAEKFQLLPLN